MVAMEWAEQGGWNPWGRRVQESLGVLRGPRWFNINIIDFDRGSNMCVHTTQHGGCNCTVATQKRKQIPAAEDDHHILVHICGYIFTWGFGVPFLFIPQSIDCKVLWTFMAIIGSKQKQASDMLAGSWGKKASLIYKHAETKTKHVKSSRK